MTRNTPKSLQWQSKAVLLIVLPWTAASALLQTRWWATQVPVVAWTAIGISAIFGLIAWRVRAGTPAAAATGAVICASLMYATTRYPFADAWLKGGLLPLLSVFLLTFVATKIGKARKDQLGTGEGKRGRNAAQVAANLGAAALFADPSLSKIAGLDPFPAILALVAISALAEAAADTVSSEIGQVFGKNPRMITTLRRVEPGTDGGITLQGTAAGILAAAIVSAIGVSAMGVATAQIAVFTASCTIAGTFGLLFDSLLGATLEQRGLLNNDAVNFLSTVAAAILGFVLNALFFVLFPISR